MIKNKDSLLSNALDNKTFEARKYIVDTIEYVLKKIDAQACVEANLDKIRASIKKWQPNNIYLIALGKAALPMAEAVTDKIVIKDGIVITDKKCDYKKLPCVRSSHPIPTSKSIKAAKAIIKIVEQAKKDDLIIFLISGGGSALVELPRVSLEDLQIATEILIKHSLSINEINCIRKHLSAIKGGQIIKNTQAKIVSLLLSDVVGDDLSTIASGLTFYDETSFDDAVKIIYKYKLEDRLPSSVVGFLKSGDERFETLKKSEFDFSRIDNVIISSNAKAVEYAVSFLSKKYGKISHKTNMMGSVKGAVDIIVKTIKHLQETDEKPAAFIFGGEFSVDVKGNGIGGRNQELAMLLTDKLNGVDVVCAAFATDGKDGNSNAAGAMFDKYTQKRAKQLGLNIKKYMKNNDSFNFFNSLNDCIFTQDTKTNVADLFLCIVF